MQVVSTEEFQENGYTYEKVTYDNGTVDVHIKPDPIVPGPEPEPQPAVTNEDIMNKLNEMSGEQVSKASLDAAYKEGVNSYGE